MLTTLRIRGFALVDEEELHLGPGLNVLTGETGAGKSLIVDALHLVLGGRTNAEVVREGAEEASVEALFELPAGHPVWERLTAAGLPGGEGEETRELLVRRVVARGGRGRVFVNGAMATVGILAGVMRGVVDVSGQHEHVSLLDPAAHLPLLDAFGGIDLAAYREAFAALTAIDGERRSLGGDDAERARRLDYLAFQLEELENLAPKPGEDQALEAERRVLASAARLSGAASTAESLCYGGEGSAAEKIGRAIRGLGEVAGIDARLEGPLALLRSASAELDEAGRELSRYGASLGGDPGHLAELEDRLEALRRLARKHGGSLETALARQGEMRAEREALLGAAGRLAELAAKREERAGECLARAKAVTEAREKAAKTFCAAVERELEGLAMARCRLSMTFAAPVGGVLAGESRLTESGAESAELLLAPNPGEPPRPLAKIASGGELSRILLAVKRALARARPEATLGIACWVFDEVDAGIGGAVAEVTGRLLHDISRGKQVVCVSHLPQIAAYADRHLRVEKRVQGGRTATRVVALDAEEARRGEVARMLAGVTVTASALEHAEALIAAARGVREGRAVKGHRAAGPRSLRSAARKAAAAH